jgi:chromosome segregation ATPase
VLYGIYDAEVYWVQERLHEVNTELNGLAAQAGSFQSLLKGAPWENRAEFLEQLRVARENLSAIETRAVNSEESNLISDDIQILRSEVLRIDAQLADNRVALEREFSSIDQLKRLIKQLESQSKRLTKTIVARTYLTDFEFILCPRCGADIDEERGATDVCSLCLQVPAPKLDKKDFISEQDRVTAQIQETEELLDAHSRSTTLYERKLSDLSEARERAAHELDFKTQTYVSDRATAITNAATERPAAVSLVRRLEDYLKLFEKLDEISTGRNSLETQKNDLEGTLETLKTRRDVSEQRIRKFEENLNASESFRWMVRTISYALTNCGASAVSAPVRCSFCSTKPRFRPSVVGVARRWRTLHC